VPPKTREELGDKMFECNLSDAIVEIVDAVFNLQSATYPIVHEERLYFSKGLYVRILVNVKKPNSKSRGKTALLHFVFSRHAQSSATHCWFQTTEFKDCVPDKSKWKNTSNHDSCWRTDGIRSEIIKVYFDFCRKVAPKMAPIELLATSRFERVAMVDIEFKEDSSGYSRYKLLKMSY